MSCLGAYHAISATWLPWECHFHGNKGENPASLQGTLPRDHVVNNKLPHFMLSKCPILIPQQVLRPLMECRTCNLMVDVEITLSVRKQARKCHREKIGSVKLRCWTCVSVGPWYHWLFSAWSCVV